MKNNKFIKSTLILIIGGFFTKLISIVIKVATTRLIGTEGMGLYMLISPSFMLLIAIAQFGFPASISKLVSEDMKNNKKLVFSIIPISILINIVIFIILFIFSHFIANTLLREPRTFYPLLSIGFVLPFISISSILRGYFFGKEKMGPHVISNITEDIVRLLVIVLFVPIFMTKGLEFAVAFVVLSNIFSELTSIFVLLFFIPKNFKLTKNDFLPKKTYVKDVLDISLPVTSSRLIGTIGYFFEPIIITYFLLKAGFSNHYILTEYGIINGYIMPFLLMPSFFTSAISSALLPTLSYAYVRKRITYVRSKIKQAIFISLLIGIPVTILLLIFPEQLLKLIYNITDGTTYLKVLAPVFIFYYIQIPLTSSMQAMGLAKSAMTGTIIGMILKTLTLIIFLNTSIGLWALVIASSVNIIFVTLHHMRSVYKNLNKC